MKKSALWVLEFGGQRGMSKTHLACHASSATQITVQRTGKETVSQSKRQEEIGRTGQSNGVFLVSCGTWPKHAKALANPKLCKVFACGCTNGCTRPVTKAMPSVTAMESQSPSLDDTTWAVGVAKLQCTLKIHWHRPQMATLHLGEVCDPKPNL